MPIQNVAALSNRYGINSVVNLFNGEAGSFDDLVIKSFYDKVLLDTIELKRTEFIHQQYAKPAYIPKGHESVKLRRFSGVTEHTTPLIEGVPPKSDKFHVESVTAICHQYGRFMEFSDKVSWTLIDPVIAMYTMKYGELAAKTKERLCREEMLHSTSILYPLKATSTGTILGLEHITIGDKLTLADYRAQALDMRRMLIEPVNGNNFDVIISPETKFDLLIDDLVKEYIGANNGNPGYATGELPNLFNLAFKTTMLDDYAFGYELANPGEISIWDLTTMSTTKTLRIYSVDSSGDYYYLNVPASVELTTGVTTAIRTQSEVRLSDGSYIPEKVTWDVETWLEALFTPATTDPVVAAALTTYGASIKFDKVTAAGVSTYNNSLTAALAVIFNAAVWKQIPIHKSILLGADAVRETGVEGHTGTQMFVKQAGSAGVLDPINQRQSIGFKIDALGYTLLRPEACVVGYSIPSRAVSTNTIMYNYAKANTVAKTSSFAIPGNTYVQRQLDVEGVNTYGKVSSVTVGGVATEVVDINPDRMTGQEVFDPSDPTAEFE